MLERMWVPTLGLEDWFALLGAFLELILARRKLPGRQVNAPSGTIGKRPFWAKSWPEAVWSQILPFAGFPAGN